MADAGVENIDAGAPDAGPIVDAGAPDAGLITETKRVLFIGNSYTYVNDLPSVVASLSTAERSPVHLEVAQYALGGQTWEGHDADPAVDALIHDGAWDFVVLQDQSEQAWVSNGVKDALRSLDGKVRAAGATPVLYMTWAQRADLAEANGTTRFVEDVVLDWYYETSGEAIDAAVAPVGRAWERALREPGMVLHADDGSHPNAQGTYLAACVIYETLTGADPRGFGNGGLAVTDSEASTLQRIARETIVARERPALPLTGVWFSGEDGEGDVVASDALSLDAERVPTETPDVSTKFGSGQFAVIPYFTGINSAHVTVAFFIYRPDWSVAAGVQLPIAPDEYLVSKYDAFSLRLAGSELVAEIHTVDEEAPAPIRHSFAALAAGWHHVALTYDGTTYGLWVDRALVTSATTSGDLRAYGFQESQGIALGRRPTSFAQSIVDLDFAPFTGKLSELRLYERALTAAELQAL